MLGAGGDVWDWVLCVDGGDCPSDREIGDMLFGLASTDDGEERCDVVMIARVEKEIGWCRLWYCSRDHGPKAVAGLRAFVRIVTHPAHACSCCPICNIEAMEEDSSLLSHVIDLHTSARFNEQELLSALF